MNEKGSRRFSRAEFHVNGFVSVDGTEFPVRVLNICMKGALVLLEKEAVLMLRQSYPLTIVLPHSDVNINAMSTLMHSADGALGFRFDSIEADSMIHLRRLLELNLSSCDAASKELPFLVD